MAKFWVEGWMVMPELSRLVFISARNWSGVAGAACTSSWVELSGEPSGVKKPGVPAACFQSAGTSPLKPITPPLKGAILTVMLATGTAKVTLIWLRQAASGEAVGLSKKASTICCGQSSDRLGPWPAPGTWKKKLLLSVLAA